MPTVSVADAVGWKAGEMPTPAAGLTVKPFATGLDHPRWMYRLPNGDVLVAETNSPPREGGGITGWVMGYLMSKAGAGVPSANRITLLRDANGDGVAESRSVFLTGLNSPFGMALMGGYLYVANTDALVRVPVSRRARPRSPPSPRRSSSYPGGGNHWARNVIAAADGKSLYVGGRLVAQHRRERASTRRNTAPTSCRSIPTDKSCRIYAAGTAQPQRHGARSRTRARCGPSVNERDMLGSDLAARLHERGRGRRQFRLAVVLLGRLSRHTASKPEEPRAAAICRSAPIMRWGRTSPRSG